MPALQLEGLARRYGEREALGGVSLSLRAGQSLVVFGPDDHAARLTPLTDTDADALIRSVRAAPRLLGQRGAPATDREKLRELLLRVSRLADDLPEVTELDLSPIIAKPDGVFAADARIKVVPCLPQDPFLRRLR